MKCKTEKPKPEQPNRKSLSQARLDRIAHPTDLWYRGYLTWFARITSDRNRYPNAKLGDYWQNELGPLIAEIQMVVMFPPEDLDGETWELFEDEYQRLLGRAKAIATALDLRAKQPTVGCGSGNGSGNSPTREQSTSNESEDPFVA